MIWVGLIIAFLFIEGALNLRVQEQEAQKSKDHLAAENQRLEGEINHKQSFKKNEPRYISKAFNLFVNQMKIFEAFSGTQMNFSLGGRKEKESIEDHFVPTHFRGVKALPILINVQKFSNQTDMGEVLNDIFLLENRTDFKVSEISSENNALVVKGELYGI